MEKYTRNCPICGIELTYKSKQSLYQSNYHNNTCRECANVKRRSYKHTDEAKAKISKSLIGNDRAQGPHEMKKLRGPLTDTHKLNISLAQLGDKHWNWKGGKTIHNGYILVKYHGSEFASMVDANGYIREHRLVMAENLNRPLNAKEVVHHINGDKTDNSIENLTLCADERIYRDIHKKL